MLILGSGLMGSGIAQSSALSGKFNSIVVQDVSEKQLDVAKSKMAESLARIKKKNGKLAASWVALRFTKLLIQLSRL